MIAEPIVPESVKRITDSGKWIVVEWRPLGDDDHDWIFWGPFETENDAEAWADWYEVFCTYTTTVEPLHFPGV